MYISFGEHSSGKFYRMKVNFLSIRQLCDLGYVSLLTTDHCYLPSESTSSRFDSDMIDNGLSNFSSFLNYIRKHIDRLTIQAGRNICERIQKRFLIFFSQ